MSSSLVASRLWTAVLLALVSATGRTNESSWETPTTEAASTAVRPSTTHTSRSSMSRHPGMRTAADSVSSVVEGRHQALNEAASPVDHSKFGAVDYVGERVAPTTLAVLLHGDGRTEADVKQPMRRAAAFFVSRHRTMLVVAPTAPVSERTDEYGDVAGTQLSWYSDGNHTQLSEATRYIIALAHEVATTHRIPPHKIVFAGYSEGAVVALHAGARYDYGCPGGVLALSGGFHSRLALPSLTGAAQCEGPVGVLLCHGTDDRTSPAQQAKVYVDRLRRLHDATPSPAPSKRRKLLMDFREIPGQGHQLTMEALTEAILWLERLEQRPF